jgi:signal peptidase I
MTRVERRTRSGRVSGAARVAAALALTVLAGLVVAALAPEAAGFSAHVVLSGSMAPRVAPGDVVLTQPVTAAELRPGQVVLVDDPQRPGGLLLHRLVSFDAAGRLVTRGDANQSDDSVHVTPSDVRGLARVRVPWVGLPALWRAQGRFGALALAGALMAGAAVFVSPVLTRRGQPAAPSSSSGATAPPMTAGRRSDPHHPAARPGRTSTEEESTRASTAGRSLPPVPPALPRPADRRAGAAGLPGPRLRPPGDHSGCFDGGRFCGRPRR